MFIPALLFFAAASITPDSAEAPLRQPQLAARDGQVSLVYGSGRTIYYRSSPDRGQTFGAAVPIAQVGAIALGRHRGPRVVMLKDALVVTAIVGQRVATGPHAHGLPEAGDLTLWRSVDRGKSWTSTGVINDVPGAAREGLHAITADPKGNLFAVWLDLRAKGTHLYGARSTDGGKTWSENRLVYKSPDGSICQCCHPSAMFDKKGELWVMWRNALGGSRDLYLTHSADGVHFAAAEKLGTGTWPLNACPMDGGALVLDGDKVTTAWRRGEEVYMARPNEPEALLGSGKDVALAAGKDGLYAAWATGTKLMMKTPSSKEPVQLAAQGAFPALVTLSDGSVLAVWESQGALSLDRQR